MPTQSELLSIGGVGIEISVEGQDSIPTAATPLAAFLHDTKPDIRIRAHYGTLPDMPSLTAEERVFDSGGSWALYRRDTESYFVQGDVDNGHGTPYLVARFDNNFTQGDVYWSGRDSERDPATALFPHSLDYPIGQLVTASILAREKGLVFHACGVNDDGTGYLFAGMSGDGKSTIARLWKDGATVLSDDRIIVRRRGDAFVMYGTPWHGDQGSAAPDEAKLDDVFLLCGKNANGVAPVCGAEACTALLARSFAPLWDADGMRFSLQFCSKLAETVPCHRLSFRADDSLPEFIRCLD